MASITNRAEFQAAIKRRLGGDFVPVELSQDNYDDTINDALGFFAEYYHSFSKESLYLLDTTEGVQTYTLPSNIYAVNEILDRAVWSQIFYKFPTREKSPVVVDFIVSLGKSPGNQLVDAEILLQNLSMFTKMLVPKIEYMYSFASKELIFYGNPSTGQLYLIVTQLLDHAGTGEGTYWGNYHLLRYATALAKIQWAQNLHKFKGFNIPGGGELNWEVIKEEGEKEKTDLEELIKTSFTDVGTYGKIWME